MTGRYDKPLTPEQIAAVKDESIDFSDIPELDEGPLGAFGACLARTHRPDYHAYDTVRDGLIRGSGDEATRRE